MCELYSELCESIAKWHNAQFGYNFFNIIYNIKKRELGMAKLSGKRVLASIMMGLLALLVLGFSQPIIAKDITKIAVIAPEEGTDYGWNQEGVQATKALAKWLGAEIEVADGAGYGDVAPIFRDLVSNDVEWIVAWASGYGTVAPQLAQQTGVPVLVVGAFEQGLVPGKSADIETRAQEGSFLAGALASKMSKSRTVGICMSADDENWIKMAGGFVAGAKHVDKNIKILMVQIGQAGYADAAGGKRVTKNLISAGADIIFGMGDGSTFGMIQAVETASGPNKVWFIDVIGDKIALDKKNVYLSSVKWDYLPMFKTVMKELQEGTYGKKIHYINLKNEGIKLINTKHIPAKIWDDVQAIRSDVISGKITVPELSKKKDVQALMK
jgi:basic membrane protein A and related proteins